MSPTPMSRKIVVTGGAGFIGSALARALVARGDDVSVLDNFSTGKRENLQDLAGQLAVVEGDILDAALWIGFCRRGRRVSRSRHPLGAALPGRASAQPQRQRDRHPQCA